MQEFVFDSSRLLVDVERTRAWYAAHGEIAGGCDCGDCRNFIAASGGVSQAVEAFLDRLGLTLRMPGEVMEQGREADGRHWYAVLYHLVGTLLEPGKDSVQLAPGAAVWFARDSGPYLPDFPEPCFQLILDLRLPWVLDEPDPQA